MLLQIIYLRRVFIHTSLKTKKRITKHALIRLQVKSAGCHYNSQSIQHVLKQCARFFQKCTTIVQHIQNCIKLFKMPKIRQRDPAGELTTLPTDLPVAWGGEPLSRPQTHLTPAASGTESFRRLCSEVKSWRMDRVIGSLRQGLLNKHKLTYLFQKTSTAMLVLRKKV